MLLMQPWVLVFSDIIHLLYLQDPRLFGLATVVCNKQRRENRHRYGDVSLMARQRFAKPPVAVRAVCWFDSSHLRHIAVLSSFLPFYRPLRWAT